MSTTFAPPPPVTTALVYLWSIPCLLISIPLLTCGKWLVRYDAGVGFGSLVALAAWCALVGFEGTRGYSTSPTHSSYLIYGVTVALAISLSLLSVVFLPVFGLVALGICSGLAFSFEIILLGSDGLIPNNGARWFVVFILAIVGLGGIAWRNKEGVLICSATTGAWLFTFAVTMLVQQPWTAPWTFDETTSELSAGDTWSAGLLHLLDGNKSQRKLLPHYEPSGLSRTMVGVAWGITLVSIGAQWIVWANKEVKLPEPLVGKAWWKRVSEGLDEVEEGGTPMTESKEWSSRSPSGESTSNEDEDSVSKSDFSHVAVISSGGIRKGKSKELVSMPTDEFKLEPPILPFASKPPLRRISVPSGSRPRSSGEVSTPRTGSLSSIPEIRVLEDNESGKAVVPVLMNVGRDSSGSEVTEREEGVTSPTEPDEEKLSPEFQETSKSLKSDLELSAEAVEILSAPPDGNQDNTSLARTNTQSTTSLASISSISLNDSNPRQGRQPSSGGPPPPRPPRSLSRPRSSRSPSGKPSSIIQEGELAATPIEKLPKVEMDSKIEAKSKKPTFDSDSTRIVTKLSSQAPLQYRRSSEALLRSEVYLESLLVSKEPSVMFKGNVVVKNLAPQKFVSVLYRISPSSPEQEVVANWIEGVEDGKKDRFRFELILEGKDIRWIGFRVKYEVNDQVYWDDNSKGTDGYEFDLRTTGDEGELVRSP